MPASPDLFPSHVVAIRPDIDGVWSDQGDYVLTVDTPRGTRNVVASADGVIEIHVELMQELEPGSVLFVIHPAEESVEYEEGGYEADDDLPPAPKRNIPPPPPPSAASVAAPKTRTSGLFWAFLVLCVVLAALWPGLVYAFHDLNKGGLTGLLVPAGLWAAGLAALVVLFGVLPFLAGLKKTALAVLSSLAVFGASLSAGVLQPDVERLHQDGVASLVRQVMPAALQTAGKGPTATGNRSSKGHRVSQGGQATFPNLMAMLAAPVQPGNVASLSSPKKQLPRKPLANLRGGADYGPIMELIAIPFKHQ